jgi:hypothetical protein
MQLYSQKDPAYGYQKLGTSKLTVQGYGCFLCSIATLYQRHPEELLQVPGAFVGSGNLVSGVLAKYCGGEAKPATTKPPKGWCIAMTDHYKDAGFPTHFFCVNPDTKEQIDPLDFPAKVEPLGYRIVQYRPFTNTVLDTSKPVPQPIFPDVEIGRWSEGAIKKLKDQGIMQGYPDGLFRPDRPVTREELAAVVARLLP